ncbi:hypothetical protein JCM10213_005075 [Rhodosporidiobolus nylandii]
MLDNLPPELLDYTFDLIRSPLPQLWREIRLWKSRLGALKSLAAVDGQSPLWSGVRVVMLGSGSGCMAAEVLQRMVNLEELKLSAVRDPGDISGLSNLPNLRVLCLYCTNLPASFSSPFPSLHQLSLFPYYPASKEAVSQFFVPAIFPALRALSLEGSYTGNQAPLAALEGALLTQLEMLNLGCGLLPAITPALFRASTPVLLSVAAVDLENSATLPTLLSAVAPHICLINDWGFGENHPVSTAAVHTLLTLVLSSSRPRSLHLPEQLTRNLYIADDVYLLSSHVQLNAAVKTLRTACESERVEVHWRADRRLDVLRDLWAYAKRLKAAQQAVEDEKRSGQ